MRSPPSRGTDSTSSAPWPPRTTEATVDFETPSRAPRDEPEPE